MATTEKHAAVKAANDVEVGYPNIRNESPYPESDDGEHKGHRVDAVFGDLDDKGPNYRNVGWVGATVLMIKSAFGLGVLSIPFVFQA